ncbi:MAG TPA: DUF4168 domain-containing protein [Xanthobacteraceae bacterium]|nr:DUF4168 domain-containing protein [Xanthobacteraceae bacterium]
MELRVRPVDEKIQVTSRKLSRRGTVCSKGLPRHVLSTCQDCAISWNCFSRKPLALNTVPVSVSRTSRERAQRAKEGKSMQIFTRSTAAVLLIAGGLLGIPAANAQVQPPAPGASDKSANIPDQKLDAAAAAIERVASLKQDYQQRIAAAAPADKERILNEAVGALKKAVNDQGLSVEEYDSILEVAQNDPEVREKIRQRIRASIQ